MPIVLGRENGLVMALDEVGHRILVTEEKDGSLAMLVQLPETGLEIIPWNAIEVSEGAELHAMPVTPAPMPPQRRVWQRPA